jgi:hypothetical protein
MRWLAASASNGIGPRPQRAARQLTYSHHATGTTSMPSQTKIVRPAMRITLRPTQIRATPSVVTRAQLPRFPENPNDRAAAPTSLFKRLVTCPGVITRRPYANAGRVTWLGASRLRQPRHDWRCGSAIVRRGSGVR